MHRIKSILYVKEWKSKDKIHKRTYALIVDELGNLEEGVGYGSDFEVGDRVAYFHHSGTNKMKKLVDKD